MRITKSQLQKIVKEEIQTEWNSGEETDESFRNVMTEPVYKRLIEIADMLQTQDPENELFLEMNNLLTRGYH